MAVIRAIDTLGYDSYSRKNQLLRLLEQFLKYSGFRGVEIAKDSVQVAIADEEPKNIIFTLISDLKSVPSEICNTTEIIVHVYDDGDPEIGASSTENSTVWINEILSAIKGAKPRTLRLFSDMLFPSLKPKLDAYRDTLENQINSLEKQLFIPVNASYKCIEISEGNIGKDDKQVFAGSLEKIFDNAIIGRRTLCAIETIAEPCYIISKIALSHASRFYESERFSGIPLLIPAHQIRASSLISAVSMELHKHYGISFSPELISAVLSLGYVHLYIQEVECWRTSQDLEPNTQYFAELLAAMSSAGLFTLGCSRDDVFQYLSPPVDENSKEDAALRTLGDRFRRDTSLTLLDFGHSEKDILNDQADKEATLKYLSDRTDTISSLSRNLITKEEAERLLGYLAVQDLAAGGRQFMRKDMTQIVRHIVKGDRGRVVNISSIEAGLLMSGVFAIFDGEYVTFVSDAFRTWLVARMLRKGLKSFLETGRKDILLDLLSKPGLSWWILEKGLVGAGLVKTIKEAREKLPSLLNRFGLLDDEGSDAADAVIRQNLVRILLLTITIMQKKFPKTAEFFANDILDAPRTIRNLSMCQAYFKNIKLIKWKFEECDLRSSVFHECDLKGTVFTDCFLGGAIFRECEFDKYAIFKGSELSGAMVINDRNQNGFGLLREAGLEEVNLTAAEIRDYHTGQNLYERLQHAGILMTNATIKSDKHGEAPINVSDEYLQACASIAWNDECPVVTPLSRKLISSGDALSLANGWNGAPPIFISAFAQGCDNEFLIAEHPERGFCIGLSGESWVSPSKLGSCHAENVFPAFTIVDNMIYVARISIDYRIERWQVFFTGDRLKARKMPLDYQIDKKLFPTSLLWLNKPMTPEPVGLLIGCENGAVHQWLFNKDSYDKLPFREPDGTPVNAMAFAPIHGIAYIAGADSRVFGYRFEPGKVPLCLFSFQTAHKPIKRLDLNYETGQVFIFGPSKPKKESNEARTARVPLFALANIRGDVLAVWPDLKKPPKKLPHRREKPKTSDTKAERLLHLKDAGTNYTSLHGYELEYNPYHKNQLTIELQPKDSSSVLPSRRKDDFGSIYRIISAEMHGKASTDEDLKSRNFIEADFDIRETQAGINLSFMPDLPDKIEEAEFNLKVNYSTHYSKEEPLRIDWRPFNIVPKRDDNPFPGDGNPVEGKNFFGLDYEMKSCIDTLKYAHDNQSKSVILMGPRRSGKTSFFRQAKRILIHTHQKVCVEVSGEAMFEPVDFYKEIKSALLKREAEDNSLKGLFHRLSPEDGRQMLVKASEAIKNRIGGQAPYITILVDEWGLAQERKIVEDQDFFGVTMPELRNRGVNFMITSVPGSFPNAETYQHSGAYRYVTLWLTIGRLDPKDVDVMVYSPLQPLGYRMAGDFQEKLKQISSCAPDDVNRIMHDAYSRAQQDVKIKNQKKEINLSHLDGYEKVLIDKYEKLRGYLYDKLEPHHKRWLLKQAKCMDGKPPIWDRYPLWVGLTREFMNKQGAVSEVVFDPLLVKFYDECGLSQPIENKKDGPKRLWIPWGLTLWLKQQAKLEGI